MPRKLTQEEAEKNVLNICKKRNFTLLKPFIYITSLKTTLSIKCNVDGNVWYPIYNNFISKESGCPICGGVYVPTQEEAEKLVSDRCDEMNYTLIKPFKYNGNKKTILRIKCNVHNFVWNITYNGFINHKNKCVKCTNTYQPTQKEAEKLVIDKCDEMNYTLLEPFKYNGTKKTILKIKCNKDSYEWTPSYYNFVTANHGCSRCKKIESPLKEVAQDNILKICEEKKYTLLEPINYKNNTTILKIKCNIDGHEWEPTYATFTSGCGCKKCAGSLKLTQEEAEKNISDICKEKNYILLKPFIYSTSQKTILYLKCNNDGYEWVSNYMNFVANKGCKICGQKKVSLFRTKSQKNFIEDAIKIHGNNYDYSLVEYINGNTQIKIICHEHGVFLQKPVKHLQGHRCTHCSKSKGENNISNILNKHKIKYIDEHRFDKCRNKNPLPFDFYLPKLNVCIEFDGEQHYKSFEFFGGEKRLNSTQRKDQIKSQYCKTNNIKLIRIPYWEFDNIEEILKKELGL